MANLTNVLNSFKKYFANQVGINAFVYTDSKIDINPEIAPADYNSFFENFNKISKDKSEPDRVMRRLNAETVQRRFYRKIPHIAKSHALCR